MELKNAPITSKTALTSIDGWRANLWPAWNLEQKIETYANGGVAPGPDDDDTCSEDVVPLGFAQQFMQKQMDPLTDPLFIEPGIINAQWEYVDEDNALDRKGAVESAVSKELNKIAHDELATVITQAAGRITVTGRCAVYWRSPNEWCPYNGRIIHPQDAGINPMADDFREWAFMGKLTIKEIEEGIKSSKEGGKGWQKEHLQKLKLWIMAAECQRTPGGNYAQSWGSFSPESWLGIDLYGNYVCSPIEVYWYYRKNGKRTDDDHNYGGHEKIDLYCISRFGNSPSVESLDSNGKTTKWLNINKEENKEWKRLTAEYKRSGNEHKLCELDDNDQLLYSFEDRFKSVNEALIIGVDDARVAGEQKLAEVRGVGRQAMGKLACEEGLLSALLEGMTFAALPNWTVDGGVSQEDRARIERAGSRSFQAFPVGVTPMAKQNSFVGMGQGMEMLRLLDTSIAANSRTSGQPTLGGAQAEFAAQANAQLSEVAQGASRRLAKWLKFLDKIIDRVGRVLCKDPDDYVKGMPSYWDAKRLEKNLKKKWKVKPDEWEQEDWCYSARKMAGAMQRQQAVGMAAQMIQLVGPIFPSVVPQLAREALRGMYGDVITEQMLEPSQKQIKGQAGKAFLNVTQTFVTGVPAEPDPMDDPGVNVGVVLKFATDRVKQLTQAGFQTPSDQAGMSAVLIYGAGWIKRLPEQIQPQFLQQFQQIAQAGQAVPLTTPPDQQPDPIQVAKLKQADQKEQRLAGDSQAKRQSMDITNMTKLRQLGTNELLADEQKRNGAVSRAEKTVGIAKTMREGVNGSQPTPP